MNKEYIEGIDVLIPSDLASVPAASTITGYQDRTIWEMDSDRKGEGVGQATLLPRFRLRVASSGASQDRRRRWN